MFSSARSSERDLLLFTLYKKQDQEIERCIETVNQSTKSKQIRRNFPLIHGNVFASRVPSEDALSILEDPENTSIPYSGELEESVSGRREPEPPYSRNVSRRASLADFCHEISDSCQANLPLQRAATEHALDGEGRIIFASSGSVNSRQSSNGNLSQRQPSMDNQHSIFNQIAAIVASRDQAMRPQLTSDPSLLDLGEALTSIAPPSNHNLAPRAGDESITNAPPKSTQRNSSEAGTSTYLSDSPVVYVSEAPISSQVSRHSLRPSGLSSLHMDGSSVSLSRIPQQFWLMPASVMLKYEDVSLMHETSVNLTTMDAFYRSNFTDYVRDPLNVSSVARDMSRVSGHYDVATISRGIEYVSQNWSIISVAKFIKVFTIGWNADKTAILVLYFTRDSMRKVPGSDLSTRGFCELAVMMVAREEAKNAALFVYTLCQGIPSHEIEGWPISRLAEFVSWMDLIGGWDRPYLQDFTAHLISLLEASGHTDFAQLQDDGRTSKESFKSNESLTESRCDELCSKLHLAKFRLDIVNHQLSMAEWNETNANESEAN